MPENKRFMEAVAAKVGAKRKPMMKRKGGPSVIIAIGAPKPAPMGEKPDGEMEDTEERVDMKTGLSKAEKIAALQEKIASLKAELALLEDEDESEDEGKMAEDEQDYEDEDED